MAHSAAMWWIYGVVTFVCVLLWVRKDRLDKARERMAVSEAFEVADATTPAKKRKIAVLGGLGFVGRRLIEKLLEIYADEADICVFDVVIPAYRDSRVAYYRGDIRSLDHLKRALTGVDTVFHVASLLPSVGVADAWIEDVNVNGVKRVIEACKLTGVRKLIYTSSATVILDKHNLKVENATEDWPYPKEHIDMYTTTKRKAEELVLAAHSSELATCVVRPAGVYGKGDKVITDLLLEGRDRFYIGEGGHWIDFVHVDSVAQGHILAEQHLPGTASKQIYNLGNNQPTMYRRMMGAETGDAKLSIWGHPHPKSLPLPLVRLLAKVNETWALWMAKPLLSPSLSEMSVDFTQRTYTFSSDKAKRELGYEPVFGGDIAQTAKWMREQRQSSSTSATQTSAKKSD